MKEADPEKIDFTPIGEIRSEYKERKDVPRQSYLADDIESTIMLYPEYERGMSDLEGFSHIIVLAYMHLSSGSLVARPPMDGKERGVFATRSPSRPNSIGLSVAKVKAIKGTEIHVTSLELVHGTPILDIKPYIPALDCIPDAATGWVDGKT